MSTTLVVNATIDGIHSWPNAPEQYKEFSQPHRHLFKIICFFPMIDSNDPSRRQKELWELRSEVIDEIYDIFASEGCPKESMIDFGTMSCEGIADLIKDKTGASKVFVGEDVNFGAMVS